MLAGGTSGESSICVATPANFIGASQMKQIPLTQGKVALVDDADYGFLNQFKWSVAIRNCTTYAVRNYRVNGKCFTVLMHRLILGILAEDGRDVDHKDGNGLHNFRDNLQACSRSQNIAKKRNPKNSSSKYKGVYYDKRASKKWCVRVTKMYKTHHVGLFDSEVEAAQAYDKKAKELFGDFCFQNFERKENPNENS
jgi:hypothetical protein